jgi:hypothetical protein
MPAVWMSFAAVLGLIAALTIPQTKTLRQMSFASK